MRFPRPQKYDREPDEASQFVTYGIEDANAQTTISLQEGPLGEIRGHSPISRLSAEK
jgi:hypothetical protein